MTKDYVEFCIFFFEQVKCDFVDAETGCSLGPHPLKSFFQGFSVASRRSVSAKKDGPVAVVRVGALGPKAATPDQWPPTAGEDFSTALPRQSSDYLKCLPLPEYTSTGGAFNLNSQLPEVFMRPDLGPRACLTYGNGLAADDKVTFGAGWNLHTNMADSVTLVVHAEVLLPYSQHSNLTFSLISALR